MSEQRLQLPDLAAPWCERTTEAVSTCRSVRTEPVRGPACAPLFSPATSAGLGLTAASLVEALVPQTLSSIVFELALRVFGL